MWRIVDVWHPHHEVIQDSCAEKIGSDGIVFKTSINIGQDVSAQQIKDENDAMLLCMGATWPRDLPIEGRKFSGIHFAMEFLQTWQQKQHGDDIFHSLPRVFTFLLLVAVTLVVTVLEHH